MALMPYFLKCSWTHGHFAAGLQTAASFLCILYLFCVFFFFLSFLLFVENHAGT